ncbi:MAG: response regulator transcription factor [Chloroflexi bacterium]|nr:response regulator transcription factor [Chloroflexota bacterium]
MTSILIIDDDVDLAVLLSHVLRLEGYEPRVAHDAQAGLDAFRKAPPDLVVLDHFLPGMTGQEVCQRIRQQSSVPIIMLTASAHEETIVGALEGGADDYVTKPFRPRQLLARMRAVLRRAGRAEAEADERIAVGPIVLDLRTREVTCADQPVSLTPTEFRLLHYLATNAGRVLTFEQIIQHVWGFDGPGNESLVRVHMSRLRKKLEAEPSERQLLESYPRVGYGLLVR